MTESVHDRQFRTDIEMQVVARAGEVHLLFNEEDPSTKEKRAAYTANFLLSPSDALVFGALVTDLAFEADTGLKPAGSAQKAEFAERHRKKLVARLTVVFNSVREKKTISNRSLARKVVDICLSDILDIGSSGAVQ